MQKDKSFMTDHLCSQRHIAVDDVSNPLEDLGRTNTHRRPTETSRIRCHVLTFNCFKLFHQKYAIVYMEWYTMFDVFLCKIKKKCNFVLLDKCERKLRASSLRRRRKASGHNGQGRRTCDREVASSIPGRYIAG